MRMIQRCEQLRLALETRRTIGIRGEQFRENFERDVAIEFRIAGAIDLAHPARSEQRRDFVVAESHARREGHVNVRGIIGEKPLRFGPIGLAGGGARRHPVWCASSNIPRAWHQARGTATLHPMPTIDVNGFTMYYEARGEGEPLLLLHGGSGVGGDWAHIFP